MACLAVWFALVIAAMLYFQFCKDVAKRRRLFLPFTIVAYTAVFFI